MATEKPHVKVEVKQPDLKKVAGGFLGGYEVKVQIEEIKTASSPTKIVRDL